MSYQKRHPVVVLITGLPMSGRKTFSEILKNSMPQGTTEIIRIHDIVCEEASKEFYIPLKYFTDKKYSVKPLQPYETFEGYSSEMIARRWEKVQRKENKFYWADELFKRMDKTYRSGIQFIIIPEWKKMDDMEYLEQKIGTKYVIKIQISRDLAPSLTEEDDIDMDLIDEESDKILMDYYVRNDKTVVNLYKEYVIPICGRITEDYIPMK